MTENEVHQTVKREILKVYKVMQTKLDFLHTRIEFLATKIAEINYRELAK